MFWNILLSMRIYGILFEHMPKSTGALEHKTLGTLYGINYTLQCCMQKRGYRAGGEATITLRSNNPGVLYWNSALWC